MSREIRQVPPDWRHPTDRKGKYEPLYDTSYEQEAQRWINDFQLWERGEHPDQKENPQALQQYKHYWEYGSMPPDPAYYRPDWPEGSATAYQIYETVSEGTPVSPVFTDKDQMLDWLVRQGYSRHAAESFLDVGSAPTMLVSVEPGTQPKIYHDIGFFDFGRGS